MTSELRQSRRRDVRVAGRRFEFAPHNCFACGTLNTNGLGLALHLETARSWTELRLDRRFEGWEGVAHGGIVSTILDEVMAWALVAEDHWGVTARMSVEFRKPVPIDMPIRADGWIDPVTPAHRRDRGRSSTRRGGTCSPRRRDLCRRRRGSQAGAARRYGFRFLRVDTDTPDSVDSVEARDDAS